MAGEVNQTVRLAHGAVGAVLDWTGEDLPIQEIVGPAGVNPRPAADAVGQIGSWRHVPDLISLAEEGRNPPRPITTPLRYTTDEAILVETVSPHIAPKRSQRPA